MTFWFQQLGMALWPAPRSPALLVAPMWDRSAVPGMILAFQPVFCSYWAWKEVFSFSLKKKKGFVFIF